MVENHEQFRENKYLEIYSSDGALLTALCGSSIQVIIAMHSAKTIFRKIIVRITVNKRKSRFRIFRYYDNFGVPLICFPRKYNKSTVSIHRIIGIIFLVDIIGQSLYFQHFPFLFELFSKQLYA